MGVVNMRQVKLVILCEDKQHAAFIRRFFGSAGWNLNEIRVEKNSMGQGSGEQWVRTRFPKELQEIRRRHVRSALITMIDADNQSIEDRFSGLDSECAKAGISSRNQDDPVAVFIPRRNIETWIEYLSENEVDEWETYPKLTRERECADQVRKLKEMCDTGNLRPPAPQSLEIACEEYQALIRKLNA